MTMAWSEGERKTDSRNIPPRVGGRLEARNCDLSNEGNFFQRNDIKKLLHEVRRVEKQQTLTHYKRQVKLHFQLGSQLFHVQPLLLHIEPKNACNTVRKLYQDLIRISK